MNTPSRSRQWFIITLGITLGVAFSIVYVFGGMADHVWIR